ncbi:MAG TPA: hypothetical protein VED40_02290 [Azospirillaceae bacterium]|nr:hypothetical protein [Azospirillaceae bacterium]
MDGREGRAVARILIGMGLALMAVPATATEQATRTVPEAPAAHALQPAAPMIPALTLAPRQPGFQPVSGPQSWTAYADNRMVLLPPDRQQEVVSVYGLDVSLPIEDPRRTTRLGVRVGF